MAKKQSCVFFFWKTTRSCTSHKINFFPTGKLRLGPHKSVQVCKRLYTLWWWSDTFVKKSSKWINISISNKFVMLFKLKRTGHNEDDVSLWQRTTVRNIFWIILWRRKQNLIDSLDKTKLLCSCKHSGLIAIFWIYPASPISSERQQGINHVVNKIVKLITWVKNFSLYFASKTGSTVTPSTLAGVWQNKIIIRGQTLLLLLYLRLNHQIIQQLSTERRSNTCGTVILRQPITAGADIQKNQ